MWAGIYCLALLSLVAAQAPPPAFFTLTDATPGANCNITNGGACISDLNYGNDERCAFRAEGIISVSATTFDTETKWDYITIGGTRYSGTSGPSDAVMAAGETIAWDSDEDTTAGGFVICASPACLVGSEMCIRDRFAPFGQRRLSA